MTTMFKCLTVAGLGLTLFVAGCGRKADLETPSASTAVQTETSDTATGVSSTDVIEDTKEEKRFFLDPLIGLN